MSTDREKRGKEPVWVPAEEAFATSAGNPAAKWPARGGPRLGGSIAFPEPRPSFRLYPNDTVMTIGSCFARNIESYLATLGFDMPMLSFRAPRDEWPDPPNGILNKYTPEAILNELRFALEPDYPLSADDHFVEIAVDRFIDLHLPSPSAVSLERARSRRLEIQALFKDSVERADVVVLTLGLIEAWWDAEKETFIDLTPPRRAVARYPNRFFFRVLDYNHVMTTLIRTVDLLQSVGATKRILITTSPVPLERTFTGRDVIVANAYSKSLLRVAAQDLANLRDSIDYFPSYESVISGDPKHVWDDDLRHVPHYVVGPIVIRMIGHYLDDGARQDPAIQIKLAAARANHGDYNGAFDAVRPLLDNDPQNAELLALGGRCLLALKRAAEAEEMLRRALSAVEERETKPEILLLMAEALATQDRLEEAVSFAERAASAGLAAARVRHIRLLLTLGRAEEAVIAAETAVGSDDNDVDAHKALADAYLAASSPGKAEKQLAAAIEKAPYASVLYFKRGAILAGMGRLKEGIALVERACGMRPDFTPYQTYLKKLRDKKAAKADRTIVVSKRP